MRPPKTERVQFGAQLDGGREGAGRAIMDAAQPPQHEAMKARIAVVLGVGVKIGVKTRGHGNAERARRSNRRGAERTFGDDVNQVGALRAPLAEERPAGRQAEAEQRVARHRETG